MEDANAAKLNANIKKENINDLKETLNSAKNSIKTNFSDLLSAIEATVQDEQIKNESLEVIKKMKNDYIALKLINFEEVDIKIYE